MWGRNRLAMAAIAWCVAFAALHVFWALGGSAGLSSSAGIDLAARRPTAFVLFGLWGVAVLLLAAAAVIVIATSPGLTRVRLAAGVLVGLAGVVMIARGLLIEFLLLTDVGGVRSEVGPDQTRWSLWAWNPWFVLGGGLFIGTAWRIVRGEREGVDVGPSRVRASSRN